MKKTRNPATFTAVVKIIACLVKAVVFLKISPIGSLADSLNFLNLEMWIEENRIDNLERLGNSA
jgi:hypothetical protein